MIMILGLGRGIRGGMVFLLGKLGWGGLVLEGEGEEVVVGMGMRVVHGTRVRLGRERDWLWVSHKVRCRRWAGRWGV